MPEKKIGIDITIDKDKKIQNVNFIGLLNKIDYEIINLLSKEKLSIAEISKKLDIAPVNTWKHLNKLESLDLITLPKVEKGKKKYPELKKNDKVNLLLQLSNLK